MIKAERKNKPFIYFCAVILIIYIIMFLGNYFTPKVVDDFGYCYNWATGERVKSIADIAESMKVHRVYANGRVIPHGIVQFFLIFPDIVFDIINPLFFVAELLLIIYYAFDFKISPYDGKALIVFGVFGLIWLAQPAFGQVNFWLDGSCNYLIASVVHLVFFLPYYKLYKNAPASYNTVLKVLFVLFGFIAGAFSENGSAAVMAMAGITLLIKIIKKEKVQIFYYLSLITSFTGYVSMVFVPATASRGRLKLSLFGFIGPRLILSRIRGCLLITGSYMPVVAVFIISAMFLLLAKEKKAIKTSLIFVFGSFVSLFLLVFVPVQSDRRGYFSVILMVVADLVLINELNKKTGYRKNVFKIICCFAAFSIIILGIGLFDVYRTNSLIRENRQYILDCRNNGQYDVKIQDILPKTKYSAIDGLKYIDTADCDSWPNDSMAKYYGVNSITGIQTDD
ncbi:MAG: hypothetical protein IJK60_06790 [Clostridia bacterium]|nr:hypothetical protein [Clostridia bacterium]